MTPIIYSTTLVDLTRDFARCDMAPGAAVDLREAEDGRVAVRAKRRSGWFSKKGSAVVVGFLDQPNTQLIHPHLAQLDSLRVRIVSASGVAQKPTNASISVWGNVGATQNTAARTVATSTAKPAPVPAGALPAE